MKPIDLGLRVVIPWAFIALAVGIIVFGVLNRPAEATPPPTNPAPIPHPDGRWITVNPGQVAYARSYTMYVSGKPVNCIVLSRGGNSTITCDWPHY